MENLSGYRLAVVGGDRREAVAARLLAAAGARVRTVGLPTDEFTQPGDDQRWAVKDAHAVIYPVRGIDGHGKIAGVGGYGPLEFDPVALTGAEDNALLIIGSVRPSVKRAAQSAGIGVCELTARDDFAIANAIPTAEGAIAAAIATMSTTLHDSATLVIGYGRCGRELADRLRALGAHSAVVARSEPAQAAAFAAGHTVGGMTDLRRYAADADVIFNTVPAIVFTADIIPVVRSESHLFELASPPGGFDREACAARGLRITDLPGLPGKVAPVTAGRYLAQAVARAIRHHIPAPA